MKEKINRLARGIIENNSPVIEIEPKFINSDALAGDIFQSDISLISVNNVPIKGIIYCDDPRIHISNKVFGGDRIHIFIEVNCHAYEGETSIIGEFCFVTNGGEFKVPYQYNLFSDVSGERKNEYNSLTEFSLFAQTHPDEAVKVFKSERFVKLPFMNSKEIVSLYNGLIKSSDINRSLDEFLIATETKEYIPLPDDEKSPEIFGFNEISKDKNTDFSKDRSLYIKKLITQYYKNRLYFESSKGSGRPYLLKMKEILEKLTVTNYDKQLIILLRAEVLYLLGEAGNASLLANSVRDFVLNNRQENIDEYFLLQYIDCIIENPIEKKESLIRLAKKLISEEGRYYLYLLLLKLDTSLKSRVQEYYRFLHNTYDNGIRSPFLYIAYIDFLSEHKEYLHNITDFEMHSIYFGCRYGLISSELASEISSKVQNIDQYHPLYFPVLKNLYSINKDNELVSAICLTLVKANRRDTNAHKWYSEYVKTEAENADIYSYYLYSINKDEIIEENVLKFFSKDNHGLDYEGKKLLYGYIITNKDTKRIYYKYYKEEITSFCDQCLRKGLIDETLAEIYKFQFKNEFETKDYPDTLPALLSSYKIATDNHNMTEIIVLHPELEGEDSYNLINGKAIVKQYTDGSLILFSDINGIRYASVEYTSTPLISSDKLWDDCNKSCSDNTIVRLKKLNSIMNLKTINNTNAKIIERSISELPLSDIYKKELFNRLLSYYDRSNTDDVDPDYLVKINRSLLDSRERARLCNALISCGHMQESYDLIKEYGYSNITPSNLKELCSEMIKDRKDNEDSLLLILSARSVSNKKYDKTILKYLCKYYNGSSTSMFNVLKAANSYNIEFSDMPERLLAQMVFSEYTENIDQVFNWYTENNKVNESLVKAFFTIKCTRYFIYQEKTDDQIFEYLEKICRSSSSIDKVPLIHLLALSKYLSSKNKLTDERVQLSVDIINYLLEKGMIFPYFKDFRKYINLPPDVLDNSIITYHAQSGEKPELYTRVVPTEIELHRDDFINIFENIFANYKILFEGESLQYEIYENEDGFKVLKDSGRIRNEDKSQVGYDRRFNMINEISRKIESGSNTSINKLINEYYTKEKLAENLFKLM